MRTGTIDNTYNPALPSNTVYFEDVDSQDRPYFSSYNSGSNSYKIIRLNADGSLDTSFDAGAFSVAGVKEIVIQPDGKILVGGADLKRLNSDGSADTAFNNPTINGTVNAVAVQPDGKILIGGMFTSVNSVDLTSVSRLNADGTLDTTFNVILGSFNSVMNVNDILVQSDGKILIGGIFSGVNGFNRLHLVRLNADGSLDTSFNTNASYTNQIIRQPDGKYLVMQSGTLSRFNADGSTDSSFMTKIFDQ